MIRAPGRKAARRSAPAFALLPGTRVLRLRACATAAGMLQHSSVFHGTSCVPTCPRPDSNRRRPPPEGGALSAELQGRMPSRRGDVATRLPIRRLTSSFRYSSWRCDLPRLPLLGRWCLACVPHGRFDLCARPPEQKFRQPVGLSPTFPQSQRLLTCPPWDSNPQPKV